MTLPLTEISPPTVQGKRGVPCGPGGSALKPLPMVTVGGVDVSAGSLPSAR